MPSVKKHKLFIAVVPKGRASKIVAAAKKAGAHGGTIIQGRGTATRSIYESLLGIAYEPEKELVIIGSEDSMLDSVMAAASQAGNLHKPGAGVGFVIDLADFHGVAHLAPLV